MYTREEGAFFRYTSTGGTEFDRTAVVFDELYPSISEVVEIDGRTLIVGTRRDLLASTLAVWEFFDDGSTAMIELDGAPTGSSIGVDDAIVVDGAILAGGTYNRQSLVWTITLA